MKNLVNQSGVAGSVMLGLALIIFSSFTSPIAGEKESAALEAALEQYTVAEVEEELLFVDSSPEKIVFIDGMNVPVYESDKNEEFTLEVQKLIRQSDLIMEFDGVKYYRLNI